MTDRNELKHFESKKYRDGYLQSRVRGYVAYQMQALREKLGLTQEGFANLTGKKQSTISRLEDTEYGRVSVQTLLDIACSADVALIVKFASYPEFLDQTRLMDPETLQPDTIHESLKEEIAPVPAFGGAALKHFSETQGGQERVNAESVTANDNLRHDAANIVKREMRSAATEVYARIELPLISHAGAA